MEIIESIAWISVGFIPMFVCLEVTWRKAVAKGLKVDKLGAQKEKSVSVENVL
jgi:anaerobic ribonucleoside-triphosphate reductase